MPAQCKISSQPAVWKAQYEADPDKDTSKSLIAVDGRQYPIKSLKKYNIRVVSGTTSGEFFKGRFNTLLNFTTPDHLEFFRNTMQGIKPAYNPPLIVKFETPKDTEEFQAHSLLYQHYPLTKTGHLQITVRNILTRQCAKILQLDMHFPECGVAIADDKQGLFMRNLEGQTLHTWLIEKGYFDKAATAKGVNQQYLEKLKHAQNSYSNPLFQQIMHDSLNLAFTEYSQLRLQWRNILFIDYITGQGDRGTFTNTMITSDPNFSSLLMEAIDNDLTFPVSNAHLKAYLKKPPIPLLTFEDNRSHLYETLIPMVEAFLPDALQPLEERINRLSNYGYSPTPPNIGEVIEITNPEKDAHYPSSPCQTHLSIRQRICKAATNLVIKCACFRRNNDTS